MTLKLYNTLTRTKELFTPEDPKNVRLYVCGPTVYDFAHIGNARPVIVFDVLFRLLRRLYGAGHVTYVRNVTDVDDKINARAAEENVPIRELTERTLRQFQEDIASLSVLEPTHEPRATETIPEMIELIARLIDKAYAYVAEGHVLFDVLRMEDYGRLSRRSLDEMIAGARVEVAPYKRNPMDFVLWKPSSPELPGWDSPWGRGRPGWHIECSAMSWKYLGETFDIHGGGIDLVFPHHENELAQSRCAFSTDRMAGVWMHNGFLELEGRKMAKSEGNFITIRDLLRDWPGEVLRLQMLNTHYRQPLDWTNAMTNSAQDELEEWVHHITDVFGPAIGNSKSVLPASNELIEILSDDLNTPNALSFLRQRSKQLGHDQIAVMSFLCDCEFLGLMDRRRLGLLSREFGGSVSPEIMLKAFDVYRLYRPKIHNRLPGALNEFEAALNQIGASFEFLPNGEIQLVAKEYEYSEIDSLIAARNAARDAKNFKEADRIRDELAAMGVVLKDNKDGKTTWKVKRG